MVNITLIGMPRCGKSALGKLVSEQLNYQFVDVDTIIEAEGRTLAQIIAEDGEKALLQKEESALLSLYGSRMIISPGGSCVYSEKGMKHLKNISTVLYIDLPSEIIEERIRKTGAENIVGLNGRSISGLYRERKPLYQRYADLTVHLDDNPKKENALILISSIYRYDKKKLH